MIGLLVGGTGSGVGKTTVTLAIIACLRKRGYVVQPYKGGPDFLDTTHHSRVAGRTARNLDTWMLTAEANREVLRRAALGADAVVVDSTAMEPEEVARLVVLLAKEQAAASAN